MRVSSICAAACVVAVAGCASRPPVPTMDFSATPPAPSSAPEWDRGAPVVEQDPSRPVAAATPTEPVVRDLPQHPTLASIGAPEDPRAARLVGKSGAQLEELFGRAHFVRAEKTAEIRQYRTTACVLDVFLYREPKSGTQKVEHAAVRSREGGKPDEAACLKVLLEVHWLPGS